MAKSTSISPVTILQSTFIALYAFGVIFTATEACDGYKIKINKLQSCDDSGPFKLTDPKIELTTDCFVTAEGCVEITKEFASCKVTYDVKKRGMMVPFKGDRDICEELAKSSKDPGVAETLKKYNVQPECPVKENKICAPQDQKFDVSSYKNKFRLAAGQYTGTITFDCNNGKTCYKFDVEFKRGK